VPYLSASEVMIYEHALYQVYVPLTLPFRIQYWCGLRPSVLGEDQTKKISLDLDLAHCGLGLGLAGLVLCCETRSCYIHRHDDLEGLGNLSDTIYSFSFLCLEHHNCGGQQWHLLA